jgi:hypothetical protein
MTMKYTFGLQCQRYRSFDNIRTSVEVSASAEFEKNNVTDAIVTARRIEDEFREKYDLKPHAVKAQLRDASGKVIEYHPAQ